MVFAVYTALLFKWVTAGRQSATNLNIIISLFACFSELTDIITKFNQRDASLLYRCSLGGMAVF